MTERKPPNVSFPDWVERQIRTAEQRGAFRDLPGSGKPIPDLDRPRDDMAWIVEKLRREQVDIAGVLPPALALAKQVEDLPQRLSRERAEPRVRALVADLNERIQRALLAPQIGPPVRVRPVDVEQAVTRWRADRAAAATAAAEAAAAAAEAAAASGQDADLPARRRRRPWRRRR